MIDPGLCGRCAKSKRVESRRGSVFWRCLEPSLPKYPPLPVRACACFERRVADPAQRTRDRRDQ